MIFGQKYFFFLVNGDFGQLWPKTSRRAAKQLYTDKLNVFKVNAQYQKKHKKYTQIKIR